MAATRTARTARRESCTAHSACPSALLLVLVLLWTIANADDDSDSAADCSTCILTPPAVCVDTGGKDGLRFASACLATCQGYDTSSFAPCRNTDSSLNPNSNPNSRASEGEADVEADVDVDVDVDVSAVAAPVTAPLSAMERFADEGFVLVNHHRSSLSSSSSFLRKPAAEIQEPAHVVAETSDVQYTGASRYTHDGWEYRQVVLPGANHRRLDAPAATALATTANSTATSRRLAILGADTRTAVPSTTGLPHSAVTEMDYGFGTGSGGCTGVLISRYALLTAAHCVWDGTGYKNHRFASPGRYSDGDIKNPFGVWAMDHITIFDQYRLAGWTAFDVAVVNYIPNTLSGCGHHYPGDAAGFVSAVDSTAPGTLQGYPIDRNHAQTSSGQCPVYNIQTDDLVHHDCDTTSGSSGSPLLVDNTVVAVHAFTNMADNHNGAVRLRSGLVDIVNGWANVGVSRPSCTTPPPAEGSGTPTGAAQCDARLLFSTCGKY